MRYARTVKTVFMYPLDRRWRRRSCGSACRSRLPELGPGDGLSNNTHWAENEFGWRQRG